MGEKHSFLEVLREISKMFKKFLKKIAEKHEISIFLKKCNKVRVKFWRVWKKNANCLEILRILDEKSIEKLNFYFYFGKFVTKNRAFGNNTIFLQQCFRFRGDFPLPPGYALGCIGYHNSMEVINVVFKYHAVIYVKFSLSST